MSYQIISDHIYTLYYFLNILNMFFTLHLKFVIYIYPISHLQMLKHVHMLILHIYIYILCYSIFTHIVYQLYVCCFYSLEFTYIEFVWYVHNIMYISVHFLTYIFIYLRTAYHTSPAVLWSRMILSSSCGSPFTAI